MISFGPGDRQFSAHQVQEVIEETLRLSRRGHTLNVAMEYDWEGRLLGGHVLHFLTCRACAKSKGS